MPCVGYVERLGDLKELKFLKECHSKNLAILNTSVL